MIRKSGSRFSEKDHAQTKKGTLKSDSTLLNQTLASRRKMDWSHFPIPAMQFEARFGDRVVPAFCERPQTIWAMVAEAAARHPDGEALVCGERRMNWAEVVQSSQQISAGFRKMGLVRGDRVALLLGNRIEFPLILF